MQGVTEQDVDLLATGAIRETSLKAAEKVLLEFVYKVTLHAYRITAEDSELLGQQGWSNEQIAEAIYIAGLYALFNRVADAFGLADPGYRDLARNGESPVLPAKQARPASS